MIGKIIPESNKQGSITDTAEMITALIWFRTKVDILSLIHILKLTGKYSNALSAMKHIAGEKVDVIFLDIQMPEVSGMEFARVISDSTRIVFTTAFSQYAVEGYKVNAIDYLLKPFSFSEFLAAAKKALSWFEMAGASKEQTPSEREKVGFYVKSDYKLLHLLYEEMCIRDRDG